MSDVHGPGLYSLHAPEVGVSGYSSPVIATPLPFDCGLRFNNSRTQTKTTTFQRSTPAPRVPKVRFAVQISCTLPKHMLCTRQGTADSPREIEK